MSLEEFIIKTFLEVEEKYQHLTKDKCLRERGPKPRLADTEIMTMQIVGAWRGLYTDKGIFDYFNDHFRRWFPHLRSYKTFCKQSSKLSFVFQNILNLILPTTGELFITDGFPIAVCKYVRAKRCCKFKDEATFGYCAAKDEKYYGFKGHIVIDEKRQLRSFSLTAANVDERDVLNNLVGKLTGTLIGDKGYISAEKTAALKKQGIYLHTPLRKNMPDSRPKEWLKWMRKIRKKVETTISILIETYNITRFKVRSVLQLMRCLARNFIAYNLDLAYKKT